MTPDTLKALSAADPKMRRLIAAVGPCTLEPTPRRTPFESLVRAVAYQQLTGKAAATILKRFIALFPGRRFPKPGDIAGVPDETLRGAGLSRAKVAAIRDIAAKTLAGVVPTSARIAELDDEEIVARLTAVRGVGRWTAEMLLIFQLGRPDVLPVDDFGVRNGFRLAYGLPGMPSPKELLAHGERWRPFRTTASWYLWRAVDLARAAAAGREPGSPLPPLEI
jgi:DNA-3-methyladenine glycosylase II